MIKGWRYKDSEIDRLLNQSLERMVELARNRATGDFEEVFDFKQKSVTFSVGDGQRITLGLHVYSYGVLDNGIAYPIFRLKTCAPQDRWLQIHSKTMPNKKPVKVRGFEFNFLNTELERAFNWVLDCNFVLDKKPTEFSITEGSHAGYAWTVLAIDGHERYRKLKHHVMKPVHQGLRYWDRNLLRKMSVQDHKNVANALKKIYGGLQDLAKATNQIDFFETHFLEYVSGLIDKWNSSKFYFKDRCEMEHGYDIQQTAYGGFPLYSYYGEFDNDGLPVHEPCKSCHTTLPASFETNHDECCVRCYEEHADVLKELAIEEENPN